MIQSNNFTQFLGIVPAFISDFVRVCVFVNNQFLIKKIATGR